jgi:type IV secretory pathway VirB10-like protein
MARPEDDRTDRTPAPLPRRLVKIGIGGLVVVLVLLILILAMNVVSPSAGRPKAEKPQRPDSIVQAPPATPRPRPEPQSVESSGRPSFLTPADNVGRPGRAGVNDDQAQRQVDPLVEERRKRDFESRYAGSVVVSYRGGEPTRRGETGRRAPDGLPGMPSTDEVAASVVRAFSGGVGLPGLAPQAPPPTPTDLPTTGGRDRGRSHETPEETPPIDDSGPTHRVLESSIIDAVVVNRLDGSKDSPVIGKVTNPLYSHNGAYVLIPADTKIIGETKSVQQLGETRLVVVFHRLIFPDGRTRSLDQFKGLHLSGALGLKDQVNQHYLSTFGAAAAMSVVTGAGQAVGNRGLGGGGNGTTVIAGNVGDGVGQATSQVLNRFLNRLPTITIREGNRFRVYVTSDIELPAYPSTR